MPDIVTHYHFARRACRKAEPALRGLLDEPLFFYAALGPDPWFSLGFYGGKKKALSPRGGEMQKSRTGAFLRALADEARQAEEKTHLFSYLAGFLCHYCLDRSAHPYILYKSGDYDEARPETLLYRGAHTRLERAIDCHIIRRHYRQTPWHFPIVQTVLSLKKLPEDLRSGLNRAHESVYGWPEVFDDLNRCLRDQKIFYWLMQDPSGLVSLLMSLADNGKSRQDYRSLPYYHKDIDPARCDYLNEQKAPWSHPCDESLVCCDSFPELFEKALAEAASLLGLARRYVQGEDVPLAEALGNASYETGFDCGDPRNTAPRHYRSLFL